jgi:hypothetical protein
MLIKAIKNNIIKVSKHFVRGEAGPGGPGGDGDRRQGVAIAVRR